MLVQPIFLALGLLWRFLLHSCVPPYLYQGRLFQPNGRKGQKIFSCQLYLQVLPHNLFPEQSNTTKNAVMYWKLEVFSTEIPSLIMITQKCRISREPNKPYMTMMSWRNRASTIWYCPLKGVRRTLYTNLEGHACTAESESKPESIPVFLRRIYNRKSKWSTRNHNLDAIKTGTTKKLMRSVEMFWDFKEDRHPSSNKSLNNCTSASGSNDGLWWSWYKEMKMQHDDEWREWPTNS